MNGRLTWQQVAAPDFGDAIQARLGGAEQMGSAFDKIARTLAARDNRLRDEASQAAMAQAMQMQDSGQFTQFMKGKGVAGLGIDPSRATPELLKFLNGYRNQLTGSETADFNLSRLPVEAQQKDTRFAFDMTRDQSNFDRSKVIDGRQDYTWDRGLVADKRTDKLQAEADAAAQIQKEAMTTAYGIAPGTTSKESARGNFMDMARSKGMSPLDIQAGLAEIDKLPDAFWKIDPEVEGKIEATPAYITASEAIAAAERKNNLEYGGDTLTRLYNDGAKSYSGYSSPIEGIIENARSKVDKATSGDEEKMAIFEDSAGKIASNYNTLMAEFNEAPASGVRLPPEIIGKVLEQSIQDNGGFFGSGDQLTMSLERARKTLTVMSTPENIARFESRQTVVDRNNAAFKAAKQMLESASQEARLGLSRNDQVGYDAAMSKIMSIQGTLPKEAPKAEGKPTEAPKVKVDPEDIPGNYHATANGWTNQPAPDLSWVTNPVGGAIRGDAKVIADRAATERAAEYEARQSDAIQRRLAAEARMKAAYEQGRRNAELLKFRGGSDIAPRPGLANKISGYSR